MNESKDKIPEPIKPRHWDIPVKVIQAISDAVSTTAQGNLIAAAFGFVFYGKEPSLRTERERHIFRNIRADLKAQRAQILRRQREEEIAFGDMEIKPKTAAEPQQNCNRTAAELQQNCSEIASDTQVVNGKVVPPHNIINYKEIIKKERTYFSFLRQNRKIEFKKMATYLGYSYPTKKAEEDTRIENEIWCACMFKAYNGSITTSEAKDRTRQASNLMECGIDKVEACEFVLFYLLQKGDSSENIVQITETEFPKVLKENGYKDRLKKANDKCNFLYNKLFRMGKNEG